MSSSLGVIQVQEKATKRSEVLALVVEPGEAVSFAEIGRRVGLSRERVRKIVRVAGSDARKSGRRQYYTCAECGKPFTAWPSNIKQGRRFCSLQCVGRNHSGPRVPRLTFRCEVCGRTYTRRASQVKERTRFCSRACQGRWLTNALPRERGRLKAIDVEKLSCVRTIIRAE